jgi:hypothetical protein
MFVTNPSKVPFKRPAPAVQTVFGAASAGEFGATPGMVPIPTEPDLWYLDGPLVWRCSRGPIITVPPGFISDDASIPKFLDWVPFLDRQGLSRRPGLAHDAIYSIGRSKGKAWADLMLEQFCIAEGMSAFGAGCIYQGVNLFGASSWAADAAVGKVGATSGDFINDDYYQAWIKAGASIYS